MYNFNHKPCCPDGERATKIAKRMLKKAKLKKKTHLLKFLINKHLNTKFLIPVKLDNIDDFVILNLKTLGEKIFLGNFHLRLARSYMGELIKNGFAYMINLSYVKQIKNTKLRHSLKEKKFKIIAFEISSRHKRSKVKSVSKKIQKLLRNIEQATKYLFFMSQILIAINRLNVIIQIYNGVPSFVT